MAQLDGINDRTDIRILICYILSCIGKPIQFQLVCDALTAEDIVNYFDLAEAFKTLQDSGFIECNEDSLYSVAQSGKEVAASFERKLPLTVRENAVKATIRLLARAERSAQNPCEIQELPGGGYKVTCRVLDGNTELMAVSLWVADNMQARTIIDAFQKDPMFAYTGILALMTQDIDTVGGMLLSSPQE